MALADIVELDKSFLTLFLILARTHSSGDLWVGQVSAPPPPPPVVRSWPRTPPVRGLSCPYCSKETRPRQLFSAFSDRQTVLSVKHRNYSVKHRAFSDRQTVLSVKHRTSRAKPGALMVCQGLSQANTGPSDRSRKMTEPSQV